MFEAFQWTLYLGLHDTETMQQIVPFYMIKIAIKKIYIHIFNPVLTYNDKIL